MIYLDWNATTPVHPVVLERMLPWFAERPGNAASVDHAAGAEAASAVTAARESVAKLVGARADEVVFTSGSTEALNIAILGTRARAADDAEIVLSAVEHPAVREAALAWGERARVVPVDGDGIVDPGAVADAITPATALVCVMAANNETGALQPTAAVADVCAAADVPLLVDATQLAGRLPAPAALAGASVVALSAHKMRGPKGVGALVARRRRPRPRIAPLQHGGGQERGLRPGTLNVPGIVGLGAAAELALREAPREVEPQRALGERLMAGLRELHPAVRRNGPEDPELRLPQTASVLLPGIDAHALVRLVARDLALSVGSACTTTSVEPSHVLLAMGRSVEEAGQSIRLSWGPETGADETVRALEILGAAVGRLRTLPRAA